MPYKLEFNHPHFPEGYEFGISMLGRVKNGSSLEVDEDMERSLVASVGKPLNELFKDNSHVSLSGSSCLTQDDLKQLIPPAEETAPTETTPANTGTPPKEDEEGEE